MNHYFDTISHIKQYIKTLHDLSDKTIDNILTEIKWRIEKDDPLNTHKGYLLFKEYIDKINSRNILILNDCLQELEDGLDYTIYISNGDYHGGVIDFLLKHDEYGNIDDENGIFPKFYATTYFDKESNEFYNVENPKYYCDIIGTVDADMNEQINIIHKTAKSVGLDFCYDNNSISFWVNKEHRKLCDNKEDDYYFESSLEESAFETGLLRLVSEHYRLLI